MGGDSPATGSTVRTWDSCETRRPPPSPWRGDSDERRAHTGFRLDDGRGSWKSDKAHQETDSHCFPQEFVFATPDGCDEITKARGAGIVELQVFADCPRPRDLFITIACQGFQLSAGAAESVRGSELPAVLMPSQSVDLEGSFDSLQIGQIESLELPARNANQASRKLAGLIAQIEQTLLHRGAVGVTIRASALGMHFP